MVSSSVSRYGSRIERWNFCFVSGSGGTRRNERSSLTGRPPFFCVIFRKMAWRFGGDNAAQIRVLRGQNGRRIDAEYITKPSFIECRGSLFFSIFPAEEGGSSAVLDMFGHALSRGGLEKGRGSEKAKMVFWRER